MARWAVKRGDSVVVRQRTRLVYERRGRAASGRGRRRSACAGRATARSRSRRRGAARRAGAPSRGGRPTKTRPPSSSTARHVVVGAVDAEPAAELVHRHVRAALDEAAELRARCSRPTPAARRGRRRTAGRLGHARLRAPAGSRRSADRTRAARHGGRSRGALRRAGGRADAARRRLGGDGRRRRAPAARAWRVGRRRAVDAAATGPPGVAVRAVRPTAVVAPAHRPRRAGRDVPGDGDCGG